jgi:asparagine synthase (glutamine-hydrolysing)
MTARAAHELRVRSGLLRKRTPMTSWIDQPLESFLIDPQLAPEEKYYEFRLRPGVNFLFDSAQAKTLTPVFEKWDEGASVNPVSLADEIERGVYRYFSHQPVENGFPPEWHASAFNGRRLSVESHWTEIDEFSAGDIKTIWEPNRFGLAYVLVRAYWRTGDERYGELFWRAVEAWQVENPPQRGANWKCGQEVSFRVMAWCFGLYGFLHAESTTPARVARLAQMIAVSGERIQSNVRYALTQRNNHSISEAVGLWTIGVLFPELKAAARWQKFGRNILEAEARDLIYDDGAFAQHSTNYHRVMLHDYFWALRLADLNDISFSPELRQRIKTSVRFLYQIQDAGTGLVPNYGHNDGALVLPLTNCDFRDFRPVLQAGQYLCESSRCYDGGVWDEELFWLCGKTALESPVVSRERKDLSAPIGGYYTLRSTDSFAFVRCVSDFRHRPSQSDMLHTDLWWRGQNIALDPGTYSYNAPDPWNNPLGSTAYHNTVTVDGLDQMDLVRKFVWLPWLRGRVRQLVHSGEMSYWEGEHDGYRRLSKAVVHRRGILMMPNQSWLVLDHLKSDAAHAYRLHWLIADAPYQWDRAGKLTLTTPAGPFFMQSDSIDHDSQYSLVRADENSPRGWRSPYYYERQPALSVAVTCNADSVFFWTMFGPEDSTVLVKKNTLRVTSESMENLIEFSNSADSLITSVRSGQSLTSRWDISG